MILHAAGELGLSITPIIAGLGVGGLAVALAIRPTLENIIGGFVLFADKPVRVGEFCTFGDKMGTVEEIGLRSTRLRGLDRTVITVPNADFAQMQIVNFTRRDMNLYKCTIGLRYETTPDQLRYVAAKIRKLLIQHEKVLPDPARVRIAEFDASSIDLEVFAFVNCADWNEFMAVKEDLNLRIMEIVRDSGTGFAFPSQTLYLGRDSGVDAARGRGDRGRGGELAQGEPAAIPRLRLRRARRDVRHAGLSTRRLARPPAQPAARHQLEAHAPPAEARVAPARPPQGAGPDALIDAIGA